LIPLLFAVPYLSLIGVSILAYWPRFLASLEMARSPGGFDNRNPRAQQAQLQGAGSRAMAAHHNGLEALPFFGISVLAALQRAVDIRVVSALCVLFIIVRIVFVLAYLRDSSTLRSFMFMLGAAICVVLCALAAKGGFPGYGVG
jgi:uncharacterized MAPEG superfamily protein